MSASRRQENVARPQILCRWVVKNLVAEDNDLVLLDIRMSKVSDIDGTRAVCAMNREKSATSVITITANAMEGRRIG